MNYKIYITNNWGEKDDILARRLCTTTVNNSGSWKNISYTSDISNADYIVSFGGLNKQFESLIDKTIIFQREPINIKKFIKKNHLSFSYNDLHHAWTHPEHMQMNYDDFLNLDYNYNDKIKNFSSVTSMRLHTPQCKERVNFITNFCKKYPNIMDIYGSKWDNRLGDNYKGELPFHNLGGENDRFSNEVVLVSKYNGLKQYNYSLCIENSCYKGYFTEKITDCLLSWTIPIYFGCTNIDKYFPKDSYYWIDINESNSLDKLYEIIQKPITDKNVQAMREARKLIMEKYNVWELIKNIIENNQ